MLFERDMSNNAYLVDYETRLREIIGTCISSGYNLYVKPHPKAGYSSFLNDFEMDLIPPHIVSELLDVSSFNLVFGVFSVSTTWHAMDSENSTPVYSLFDLFDFTDPTQKEYIDKVLLDLSNEQLAAIGSMNELNSVLDEAKANISKIE